MGLKNILSAALVGASLFSQAPAKAETPVILEERVVAQRNEEPLTQSLLTYGDNRAVLQTFEGQEAYGINIENKDFRLNAGIRDYLAKDKDIYNFAAGLKRDSNFAEIEYDRFENPSKEDCFAGRLGVKPLDNLEFQFSANTIGDWRAVAFLQTGDNSKIGIGGGQNLGDLKQVQLFGTTKITDDYNANASVRVGEGDFIDARLRFGRKSSALDGSKSYGVSPGFANDPSEAYEKTSDSSDVTVPYAISENFGFLSAERQCGNKTGDVGGDARFINNKKAYARFAVNVGDYGWVKDILVVPGVHKNLETGKNGLELAARMNVGKASIWYRGNFNKDSQAEQAVYVSYSHQFGGKN